MSRLSVTCFGVGDGAACGDRNHSAYLYDIGGATVLLDCGEPISRSYKASGRGYDEVDRIFLSHMHFDHLGGFFMLLQGFWLEQRRKDLTVYLPAHGIEPVKSLLRSACLFDELLTFRLRFEPLRDGQCLEVGNVTVTPRLTTHLEGFRRQFEGKYPGCFEAFAFLMECGSRRIVHSADLGAPSDLDSWLKMPVDLLVCELAHFKPEELFLYLKGKTIGRIVVTHLGRPYWERLKEIRQLAAALLPESSVVFPLDQEVVTV